MIIFNNCGQGDSAKLSSKNCCFNNIPLYVDLGPSNFSFHNDESEIDVLISHSHDDHILGKLKQPTKVRNLYVPAYFPEVQKILAKLRNRSISFNGIHLNFLYEGCNIGGCAHTEVLNPCLNPQKLLGVKKINLDLITQFLESYNLDLDNLLAEGKRLDYGDELPVGYQSESFILSMLTIMARRQSHGRFLSKSQAIMSFKTYDAHKMSIVFRYDYNDVVYLFTGDANTFVFNRLIKSKMSRKLKCTLLKVPHHGSKRNLSVNIIKIMNPKCAVISHNNGLFGKAKDPHPNKEVIQMLLQNGVCIFPTNAIYKNKNLIIPAYHGSILGTDACIV